jgi:hypothetical protein
MRQIAYIDCQSGASGDMFLGALVDAGVPLEELERGLSGLNLRGYALTAKKVRRLGLRATKVDVEITDASKAQGPRGWRDVEGMIKASRLSDRIKQKGTEIFKRLFQAEARVHGRRIDKVHLHELSAIDCVVDVIGTLIGLDSLGIDRLYSSSINLGTGGVVTEHGRLPVPAPVTLELLRGRPVYSTDVSFELTTPTGAALISSLVSGFGSMPLMSVKRIGVGAGSMDLKEQPNILRLIIGEDAASYEEEVVVIETNIDDMNPQAYEYIMERLLNSGALDVSLTNIIMKKGRPGVRLTVLCHERDMDGLVELMFRETTTIGVRFYRAGRRRLRREMMEVETRFGRVNVKVSRLADEVIRVMPEYSDCLRIAKRQKIPLLDVMREIASSLTTDSDKEG